MMKAIKNFIYLFFYVFLLMGLIGGNYFLYNNFFKEEKYKNQYLLKSNIIVVDTEKLIQEEKNYLINKYKKEVFDSLKNKDIFSLKPSQLVNEKISEKIRKELEKFNDKLESILQQLKDRGFIVLKKNCVLSGIPDATDDLKKILNLDNNSRRNKNDEIY